MFKHCQRCQILRFTRDMCSGITGDIHRYKYHKEYQKRYRLRYAMNHTQDSVSATPCTGRTGSGTD